MRVFKFVFMSLLTVAFVCLFVRFIVPHVQKRNAVSRELNEQKLENAEFERRLEELNKNLAKFENNEDFVKLTAYREGHIGPNEKVFPFPEFVSEK